MTKTHQSAAGLAARTSSSPVGYDRFAQTDGRPQRSQPLMRKYEVAHLARGGDIHDFSRIAPAIPAFEDSFAALARGAIIQTSRGPTAIEDLLPGDEIRTTDHGFQTLLWRGSTTLVPNAPRQAPEMGRLTRIAADALGIARPMHDLVLGPCARLHHRAAAIQQLTGHQSAFIPARDFIDGINIIDVTPFTPVQVFQLGFARHERFTANGVEIESQNPGARHVLNLRGEGLALYLSLFPHMQDISDFGPLLRPRLALRDLDLFDVA